ncbi:hypothetical protein [Nocardia sp. NPDC004722]
MVLLEVGAPLPSTCPAAWTGIANEREPRERCAAALALWNQDFLDAIPRFAARLTSELSDARVGLRGDGECVVVYVMEHFDEDDRYVVCWIGRDPATFGEHPPVMWECVPSSLRTFLRQVHAGFTSPYELFFGPIAPRLWLPLATVRGFPEGMPDWDQVPDASRLLPISTAYSGIAACVSPDLPLGQAVVADQDGELNSPDDFGHVLDKLFEIRFAVAAQEQD